MARIRTIKPEFWTSEQVMECSALARLLFIGIWNFCDDAGNHPMSAKTLKALVFPGDDITSAQVEGMLGELQSNGLISLYEHSSKQYLHVNGWHHQKIDRPTYKHPVFIERSQDTQLPGGDGSPNDRRGLDEGSSSGGRVLTPGREGKGNTHSPREPFEMTLEWAPDQVQLEAYAKFSGMAVEQFTPEAISGFVMHHDAKGLAQTEAQWVAALVGWVKRDVVTDAGGRGAKVVSLRGDRSAAPDFESTDWANDLGVL